ncbi:MULTISPECIES: hypothetical protein [unclassified Microbispora]|uniref:hypothetical protein n=1 Tax=unclassified Microbispora TaxID=2614687 RepID=UPI0021AF6793|nr:hypothetical protein [Microbispora sp. SCL1-1]
MRLRVQVGRLLEGRALVVAAGGPPRDGGGGVASACSVSEVPLVAQPAPRAVIRAAQVAAVVRRMDVSDLYGK